MLNVTQLEHVTVDLLASCVQSSRHRAVWTARIVDQRCLLRLAPRRNWAGASYCCRLYVCYVLTSCIT